jgi:predicted aconitase
MTTSGSQMTLKSKGLGKIQNNKIAKEIIIQMMITKPTRNVSATPDVVYVGSPHRKEFKSKNTKQHFKAKKNTVRGLPLAGKK